MSEKQQQKPRVRRNRYLDYVEEIQDNALYNELPNGIVRELTYQQALSIHLRACQLEKEGALHPNSLSPKAKANQIDKCYKQQFRKQKDYRRREEDQVDKPE